jgi:hypothetical protein
MLIAGGFNLSGNSKFKITFGRDYWMKQAQKAGFPAWGEASGSNFFQRLGYENIRTPAALKANKKKIWDLK